MAPQPPSHSTDTQIYFCDEAVPLPHVSLRSLPEAHRAAIAALHRRRSGPNVRLALAWAFIGTCVWLSVRSGHPALWAAAALGIATGFVSLATFMHESAHNLTFRKRWLNRLAGSLCGFPMLAGLSAYRTVHMTHHAHTRDGQDPDDPETIARQGIPLGPWYFFCLVAGSYLYIPHLATSGWRLASRETRRLIVLDYALVLAGHAALFTLLPIGIWLRVWLVPFVLAAQFINVKGLSEHGLTAPDNEFTSTRSITGSPVTRFLLCNQNYHLEHHLYPGVPWYNLHELHRLVEPACRSAGASLYPSYSAFVGDFVRAGRAGMVFDALLLPRELRDHFCG